MLGAAAASGRVWLRATVGGGGPVTPRTRSGRVQIAGTGLGAVSGAPIQITRNMNRLFGRGIDCYSYLQGSWSQQNRRLQEGRPTGVQEGKPSYQVDENPGYHKTKTARAKGQTDSLWGFNFSKEKIKKLSCDALQNMNRHHLGHPERSKPPSNRGGRNRLQDAGGQGQPSPEANSSPSNLPDKKKGKDLQTTFRHLQTTKITMGLILRERRLGGMLQVLDAPAPRWKAITAWRRCEGNWQAGERIPVRIALCSKL